MSDPKRRGGALRTCWSCEGTGQRFIGSGGRVHKQPCPVCGGTGVANTPGHVSAGVDWRPRWLRAIFALM